MSTMKYVCEEKRQISVLLVEKKKHWSLDSDQTLKNSKLKDTCNLVSTVMFANITN